MFYLIVGFIAGAVGMYFIIARFGKKTMSKPEAEKRDIIEEAKVNHTRNITRAEEYLQGRSQVTNDEIQSYLNVSDATAERYLDELETMGKLVQMGKTGSQVKYQVKNI